MVQHWSPGDYIGKIMMKIAETQKAVIAKHSDPALNPAQLPI